MEINSESGIKNIYVSKLELSSPRNVVESNTLITGYSDFSTDAQKIIYTTISMLSQKDKSLHQYTFRAEDLITLFQIDGKKGYKRISDASLELMQSVIFLRDVNQEKGEFKLRHLIDFIDYERGNLTIQLSDDVANYLLNLNSNFTSVPLEFFVGFKRMYSMKLLHLLLIDWNRKINYDFRALSKSNNIDDMIAQQSNYHAKIVINLDDFRDIFLLNKRNKYTSFGNLHNRLLKQAIEEINEKSLYTVTLTPLRKSHGKAVDTLIFAMKYNQKGKKIVESQLRDKYTRKIISGESITSAHINARNVWIDEKKVTNYFYTCFEIPVAKIKVLHTRYGDTLLKAMALNMQQFQDSYFGGNDWDNTEEYAIKSPISFLTAGLKNEEDTCERLQIENMTSKEKEIYVNHHFNDMYNRIMSD